jgi:hypothetical protein
LRKKNRATRRAEGEFRGLPAKSPEGVMGKPLWIAKVVAALKAEGVLKAS